MGGGIWTAVSGANARSFAVDTVANNLANADTVGYKKDQPTFREYLTTNEVEPQAREIQRLPAKEKELHPIDGRDQAFVITESTITNFKQGHLKVTDNPLDLAMDGPGFLEVITPEGVRYTRHGSLKVGTDGTLVTSEGHPVLAGTLSGAANEVTRAPAAEDLQQKARWINLRDRPNLMITEQGEIYSGQDRVAQLKVQEFADLRKLRKDRGMLFLNPDPENGSQIGNRTVVRQGVIETSNVNPVEEMTQLIKANRMFEHDLRAIKAYDEFMRHEANSVGKL